MVRNLRTRLKNLSQEWLLGISTRGFAPAPRPDAVHYATISYSDTREVLRRLDLQPTDTFVDVGAGKGRVLCLAAQHRVRQVIGIEYSSELVSIARRNVSHMRGKQSPVEVHLGAAEDFDYSAASVLYFYNPFEANVLDVVLHKLSVDRAGKPLRLAFVLETAEQRAVFLKHEWLKCYVRWDDGVG